MKKAIITLGDSICVREPKNAELSRNGGDYWFYETPVFVDGLESGVLFSTSAEFDYCQLSDRFGRTNDLIVEGAVDTNGEPFIIQADYYGEEYISLEDFKKAISH